MWTSTTFYIIRVEHHGWRQTRSLRLFIAPTCSRQKQTVSIRRMDLGCEKRPQVRVLLSHFIGRVLFFLVPFVCLRPRSVLSHTDCWGLGSVSIWGVFKGTYHATTPQNATKRELTTAAATGCHVLIVYESYHSKTVYVAGLSVFDWFISSHLRPTGDAVGIKRLSNQNLLQRFDIVEFFLNRKFHKTQSIRMSFHDGWIRHFILQLRKVK